jgi:hypothetical protein
MRSNNILHVARVLAITHAASQPKPSAVPLNIKNLCSNTIWPGIATQAGEGPSVGGFELESGASRNLTVATDWNGRVWGRTNCTFTDDGTGTCGTGNCGGQLNCTMPVSVIDFFFQQPLQLCFAVLVISAPKSYWEGCTTINVLLPIDSGMRHKYISQSRTGIRIRKLT